MVNAKNRSRSLPKTVPCVLNKNNRLIVPNKALTNMELERYAFCLKIPFFRGVFMKDNLPPNIRLNETGVVNLDNTEGPGTHWVCYKKIGETIYYYDSFGDLPPPKELLHYFRQTPHLFYNYERQQASDTLICGHLCLEFLATSVSQL